MYLYGPETAELRGRFLRNAKYCTKVVREENLAPYTVHTVVLKLNRSDVQRYVSYVLCGSNRRCHLYVTANTFDDAWRWKNDDNHNVGDNDTSSSSSQQKFEEVERLESVDPRLKNMILSKSAETQFYSKCRPSALA
jgi:hypothetical protein